MQLAKIRRKSRPVKKNFHEIWKITVDLGEFEARSIRQARGAGAQRGEERGGVRGGGGREATRRAAGCKRGAGTASGTAGRARVRHGTAGRALPGTSAARGAGAGAAGQ